MQIIKIFKKSLFFKKLNIVYREKWKILLDSFVFFSLVLLYLFALASFDILLINPKQDKTLLIVTNLIFTFTFFKLFVICFNNFYYILDTPKYAFLFYKRRKHLTVSAIKEYSDSIAINLLFLLSIINLNISIWCVFTDKPIGIVAIFIAFSGFFFEKLIGWVVEKFFESRICKTSLRKQKIICDCKLLKKDSCIMKKKKNYLRVQKNICFRKRLSLSNRFRDNEVYIKARSVEAEKYKFPFT